MMADLGTGRREKIMTTDFKENIRAFVPTAEIQATRLANTRGTEENRIARKAGPPSLIHTLRRHGESAVGDRHDPRRLTPMLKILYEQESFQRS